MVQRTYPLGSCSEFHRGSCFIRWSDRHFGSPLHKQDRTPRRGCCARSRTWRAAGSWARCRSRAGPGSGAQAYNSTFTVPDTVTDWPAARDQVLAALDARMPDTSPAGFAALAADARDTFEQVRALHERQRDEGDGGDIYFHAEWPYDLPQAWNERTIIAADRAKLLAVSDGALAEEGTIRPVIAARLLGLSEKTVRAWATAGVLAVAGHSPRLLLDVRSVHAVSHLLSELRAAGQDRDLLDQVWRRLEDAALLDRDDLRDSLDQMRRGEGRVLRPVRADGPSESR